MRKFRQKNIPLLNDLYNTAFTYPSPASLNYLYNFGILALFCLIIQLITGLLLSFHYQPNIDLAFASVERINRDVNYGWLIRYCHLNFASFFFVSVFGHIWRSLYYGSFLYPRTLLYLSGLILFFLLIIISFIGYVLPWGQMSFWGATVITNLATSIPVIGDQIIEILWGAFAVSQPTLNRFFGLHFLLPFVLLGLTLLHLLLLHKVGSTSPFGTTTSDWIPFIPYYLIKDLLGIIVALFFFCTFIFFFPAKLGHPINFSMADPLQTPSLIVPEWYFLFFYAILRCIPHKSLGVVFMLLSIIVFALLPFLYPPVRSSYFRPYFKYLVAFITFIFFVLTYLGSSHITPLSLTITRWFTFLYFFTVLVLMPIICLIENFYSRIYKTDINLTEEKEKLDLKFLIGEFLLKRIYLSCSNLFKNLRAFFKGKGL